MSATIFFVACASKQAQTSPQQATHHSESSWATPPQLRDPEWLPESARQMVATKMERHADDVTWLVTSVVLLSYEATAEMADRIASEPRLSRPEKGETDTINSLLPPKFFDLQDQLRDRARLIGKAARAHDDEKMVKGLGALTETCMACHVAYLRGGG
jgi:hypothetical protein